MSDPPGAVVSAEWLADRLGTVAVVDVRDPWEYEGIGHVPTAVNVPFDDFRAPEHAADADGGEGERGAGETGMLPGAEQFAALLGEAGISREDRLVAYDDDHGVFAARLLVTAELYGHDPGKLHLLDGDFSAWQRAQETVTGEPDVEPASYTVADPQAGESALIDQDAVAAAIDGEAVIVDTREAWEYGEGHIPGAVRLDWRELVDDESRGLHARERIEAILDDRGITRDRPIVLYCNTARRISHTYTVLRHLGFDEVAFYEGSLTEWEAAGRPVEKGRE